MRGWQFYSFLGAIGIYVPGVAVLAYFGRVIPWDFQMALCIGIVAYCILFIDPKDAPQEEDEDDTDDDGTCGGET